MKLPSRKKLLGACLLFSPFGAVFTAAGIHYGAWFGIGLMCGFASLIAVLYLGIKLLTSND